MSRFLLRVILASILAWLLGGAAIAQAAVAPPPDTVTAYAYDGRHTLANRAAPASERGPPATHERNAYHAADNLSCGAAACLYDNTPAAVAAKSGRNFDNYGGEFLDDAIRSPVVRPDVAGMSSKIQRQMGTRGWTPGLIDEAVLQGRAFPAVNKLGGANTPATRYVHPRNGQSVVIDNATGEIIQVGGPGFRY